MGYKLVALAQAGHPLSSDLLYAEVNFENLNALVMEGLGALHQESPQLQSQVSASWFSSSKSAKKYSTGKTTFIKHLLKAGYPGAHIGPEPTTDRFVVVMNGPDERSVPGNTIAVEADMPFSGLTSIGTSFLSKFECSQMPHPVPSRCLGCGKLHYSTLQDSVEGGK